MDDAQRIRSAKQGHVVELAALLQENYMFVFKYLLHVTLNRQTAEDLTQDTMMRAIEKIKLYDERRSKFSSWLLTIATRLFLDHRRRERRARTASESITRDMVLDTRYLRWQLEGVGEQWVTLIDALCRLPEDGRIAVLLKHYYGYEYGEIGDILNIPTGTAKSRVHNGIRVLREEWGKGESDTTRNGRVD